jgi:hypothetical protein
MRAEDNMTTQGIKRWLYKLFAWWPWKRTPESNYTQAVSNLNMGMTQEAMVRTMDGPVPQTGITSVVVEQEREEQPSEKNSSTQEERPENLKQASSSPSIEEQKPQVESSTRPEQQNGEKVAPTLEQKLTFLKYLVNKGQINEGFEEGNLPDQYKRF